MLWLVLVLLSSLDFYGSTESSGIDSPFRGLEFHSLSAKLNASVLTMAERNGPIHILSPLDNVTTRRRIQKFLYFPALADPSAVVTVLRGALAWTVTALPTLAGCVTSNVQDAQKGSLIFEGPYLTADDMLTVKNLA